MDEKIKYHGLMVENFKNTLVNMINSDPLDIQTKAVIVEFIYLQLQRLSEVQTQKDLQELKEKQNTENDKEVSE